MGQKSWTDERFFVRDANHRAMITYAPQSRSLEAGNDYIGTCPYAFLIHVLALHNEFLARGHETWSMARVERIKALVKGRQPEQNPMQITLDDALRMNPMTFESLAAALWAAKGWRMVSRTQRNADGGVDVVARDGQRGSLIQCKSTGSDRPLNWSAIQEITAGQAIYKRLYPSVDFELVCFTNGEFNAYAREQAAIIGVQLIERETLAVLLEEHVLRFSDVERFLHEG